MSFWRYPGGKKKLAKQIIAALKEQMDDGIVQYREPFVGGGSICVEFVKQNPQIRLVWVNDVDVALAALWLAVFNYPEPLKAKVRAFEPSIAQFYDFKAELLENPVVPDEERWIVNHGFKKLALHQTSYSGLGVKSGGPLGGKQQQSKYKIDCRWSPEYICKRIDHLNGLFGERFTICSCHDFEQVLAGKSRALVYLDPPYYVKGDELYQYSFSPDDHRRLACCLRKTRHAWVLSYDDCPEVRELYEGWADIKPLDVNYSITAAKDKDTGKRLSRTKGELLITPRKGGGS